MDILRFIFEHIKKHSPLSTSEQLELQNDAYAWKASIPSQNSKWLDLFLKINDHWITRLILSILFPFVTVWFAKKMMLMNDFNEHDEDFEDEEDEEDPLQDLDFKEYLEYKKFKNQRNERIR